MNKRKTVIAVAILGLAGVLAGCFDPPEFPDTPSIAFESISFVEVDGNLDSLILTFTFEDGDGDIGLSPEDLAPPFHSFDLVIDSRDSIITISDDNVVPPLYVIDPFSNRRFFSDTDNRPPFNCDEWFINSATEDTIYIQPNEFNKNIYIDIFRKRNGNYILLDNDLSAGLCTQTFDARIPIFDEANVGRALSGSISYAMLSQGFIPLFRLDTIKIDFFIYDQALNQSNLASTPDFVLPDIAR